MDKKATIDDLEINMLRESMNALKEDNTTNIE